MSTSEANTARYEPYQNYRFRVRWDGAYVAGFTKVSGLTRGTHVIDHRSGGDANTAHVSGEAENGPITLERGVTYDVAFEQWANKLWYYPGAAKGGAGSNPVSREDFRKDIVIELYNEAGQKVIAYNIYRCWPSEFNAIPELDGIGNAVAIQTMTLQNEGWERDTSVAEPMEPSFNLPEATP